MKHRSLRRTGATTLAVLTLGLGLAACGSNNDNTSSAKDQTSSSAPATTTSSSAAAVSDAGSQTFGPGCSAIPTSGKGSFNGMVTDPVATAASNNPLLSTLVTAVGKADLGDTLNAAPALTVFAPTNDAFGQIPSDTLNQVLADQATLTAILTHHVLAGQLDPTQIVGTHKTLDGDTVTVTGDAASGLKVDGANVICGNIPTKNATVYVIDSVLMPSAK